MQRTISQWEYCDPKAMAANMSESAVYYALSDAKADIIELHKKVEYLKKRHSYIDELLELVLQLNPKSGELGEGYCRMMQELAVEIKGDN